MKKQNKNNCEITKNLDLFVKDSLTVHELLSIKGGDGTDPVEDSDPKTEPTKW